MANELIHTPSSARDLIHFAPRRAASLSRPFMGLLSPIKPIKLLARQTGRNIWRFDDKCSPHISSSFPVFKELYFALQANRVYLLLFRWSHKSARSIIIWWWGLHFECKIVLKLYTNSILTFKNQPRLKFSFHIFYYCMGEMGVKPLLKDGFRHFKRAGRGVRGVHGASPRKFSKF